ncbi:MAG: hypothetical protein K2P17_04460 [Helicobacteraceae bacterium]|nr:hypothetical protein [Helicobacteraceae bacterium]
MILRIFLMVSVAVFVFANVNFDFIDARNKGYSDKEILDYVSKHFNSYDIGGIRGAGLSDKEIVDFFIKRDSVALQLEEFSKNNLKDKKTRNKVYPQDNSAKLYIGCQVYTGRLKHKDGWYYVSELQNFARAVYTNLYLENKDYFDINSASEVSLKQICANDFDMLKNQNEINKLYALSLQNEIRKVIKNKKSLIID